jgi:ornithine cyclodeaminase
MTDELLYLDRADVARACREIDPLAAVHESLTMHADGLAVLGDESDFRWEACDGDPVRTISMPGSLLGDLDTVGVKIINANPHNPGRGLPRADGLLVLFDFQTGRPVCVLECAELSALRTAAVSTLAAQRLAAGPVRTVTVIGAGVLGRAHIELMVKRLPGVERVLLCDRQRSRAVALRNDLAPRLASAGVTITGVDDAATAIGQASVIVTTTVTTTSYITRGALPPGVVAVNVSLDDFDDSVFCDSDRLYVDDWELVIADQHRRLGKLARAGRVVGPHEVPAPGQRNVDGTLGELLLGRCRGRGHPDDVVVVNPFGLAVHDLMFARLVLGVCVQRRLGTVLDRKGK